MSSDESLIAPLDAALMLEPVGERRYSLTTSSIFWNIAGPFGGWVFAAGAKAILIDPKALGVPREAHARFMAAPKSGTVEIRVTRLSQGRSVAFWRAEMLQQHNGEERRCAEISMLLASRRDTIDIVPGSPPEAGAPEQWGSVDSSRSPLRWLDCYDVRYVSGKPFKPQIAPSMASLMWVQERVARPLDAVGIISLADIPAPRTFLLQPGAVPTSTVSMSVYFTATPEELASSADTWLLMDIDGHAARYGFFDHRVSIWRSGQLLATSTQLAWFA
jgi:acyl-CoA thioesterase